MSKSKRLNTKATPSQAPQAGNCLIYRASQTLVVQPFRVVLLWHSEPPHVRSKNPMGSAGWVH